jgi:hypothetical protein
MSSVEIQACVTLDAPCATYHCNLSGPLINLSGNGETAAAL